MQPKFWRGLRNGLALSLILWALIIWAASAVFAQSSVRTTNVYPWGSLPIIGVGTGTTGAVVGTLAAVAGRTTYICGFDVTGVGGTATVGPVTIAGLNGGSLTYQGSLTAAGGVLVREIFNPCIPASAVNTAITTTTTAAGGATAVDVNSWGFQQ